MSAHVDYSSDEEDSIVGQQNSRVLLGFNDGSFDQDTPGIEDTFIGGHPIWMHPKLQPALEMLKCDNCGNKMALLLQAFAPLEDKLYDRVIYIFGCKNTRTCSRKKGSVKAIRGVNKDPKKIAQLKKEQEEQLAKELQEKIELEEATKRQAEMTKNIFTNTNSSKVNPFSNPFAANASPQDNPFDKTSSLGGNPFDKPRQDLTEGQVEAAAQPESSDAKKASSDFYPDTNFPSYPGSFVYVAGEKFKKKAIDPDLKKYQHLIEECEGDDGIDTAPQWNPPSGFESNRKMQSMFDDRHFQAFSETVSHNPGQLLRYDIGGKPLLYSGRDSVAKTFAENGPGLPRPGYNPSLERQFELQMMPKAIMDLEEAQAAIATTQEYLLTGMEWGTILVATDKEDYMPSIDGNYIGYVQEWCEVQWEESDKL